ncbi:Gfo/Idh/MocA family protein (plasmid) [Tundrisphaera lichenicola]|uniref:Gfo/Idh/MocA family protein n=1 Tax=Tundrisphaera lichenicola TaxID=2029860 RepID=UPI003EBF69C7
MKAALIGAGHIARQHLACLRELPNVELAGVCDLSRAMAESAAERYGVAGWYTDHRAMLDQVRPDVVHVTTPPTSHYPLAMDALDAGAHVILEKPATVTFEQLEGLIAHAKDRGKSLVEDYNYLYNGATRKILDLIDLGEFGEVTHVEVFLCLDIAGEGSAFADPNAPHPCLSMPGGAIADFLTHLACLSHKFIGPHRKVSTSWSKRSEGPLPWDELRALVVADRGTASLNFSAHSQPDAFWLRVYGTKMQATADLFETRLSIRRVRGGPKPLRPLFNSLDEAKAVRGSAYGTLRRKLDGGPGAYEGLWALLGETYRALGSGREPEISPRQVVEVNRLVADLTATEFQL